ncbi:hypothetical protein [Cupriavidus basilensis]
MKAEDCPSRWPDNKVLNALPDKALRPNVLPFSRLYCRGFCDFIVSGHLQPFSPSALQPFSPSAKILEQIHSLNLHAPQVRNTGAI